METPFVNIHTHRENNNGIELIFAEQRRFYHTYGIHPWFINNSPEKAFQAIKSLVEEKTVKAIGECGLDRVRVDNFENQLYWFEKQLQLANSYSLPVIIHCVRAYSYLIPFIKRYPDLSFIIHGYSANETITQQLCKYSVYFSFGESLIKEHRKTVESFLSLPNDRIFLETDATKLPIETVYDTAARLKSTSQLSIKRLIYLNYSKVFKPLFQ